MSSTGASEVNEVSDVKILFEVRLNHSRSVKTHNSTNSSLLKASLNLLQTKF